ncbi:MAG: OmpA family protein [Bacteroidia bacterium]|nr:OmpA family protein [Bacteroidia bacterium]
MVWKVFIGAFLGFGCVWAQTKLPTLRRLERLSELGFYEKIIAAYEAQPHAFSADRLLFVADAYLQLGRSHEAFHLYKQSVHDGSMRWDPKHILAYAQLLHARGDVARAAHYYKLYAERAKDPIAASLGLSQLANYQSLPQNNNWTVEGVMELNAWLPVYAAWWTGAELYATSRAPVDEKAPTDRMGRPYERIVPRTPTRYKYHQSVVGSLGADTLLLYLSRGKGNIYMSAATASGWSKPQKWRRVPLRPQGRVSIAIDPKTQDIYFTQDPGLHRGAGRDLYRFRYLGGGKYSTAERLPAPINTPYDEDAPFIVGDTLYFASNGLQSAGGYDIFYAIRSGEREWSSPQPMPAPINSWANDIYFYPFSPEHIYFSSDREGAFRVYRARYTPPPPPPPPAPIASTETTPAPVPARPALRGQLLHRDTKKGLNGEVILVDSASQKEVTGIQTSLGGYFRLYPPEGGGVYYLYAQAPGFMTHVQVLRIPPEPTVEMPPLEVSLAPIEMEATFALRNIYFDFNSDKLKPESIPELNRLKRLLQENPNVRIRFSGHTDNIGGDKYNQQLSERRARAVYKWLREQGVHPIQMEYIGYGKSRPIASNTTEEGRSLNRRIEMEVVGIRTPPLGTAAKESKPLQSD